MIFRVSLKCSIFIFLFFKNVFFGILIKEFLKLKSYFKLLSIGFEYEMF